MKIESTGKVQYKIYTFLCMLYAVILAETFTLMFKLIAVGSILESGAILFIPVMYMIEDMIAEVYGFKAARRLIFWSVITSLIYCLMIKLTVKIPSPDYWQHQGAFNFVLGSMGTEFVFAVISMIGGELLNIYLVSRWKSLLQGKHFWIRSIIATSIGELFQSIVVYVGNFHNFLSLSGVERLIISAYLYKVAAAVFLVIPAVVLVRVLKNIEGVDVYDNRVAFNPFKI